MDLLSVVGAVVGVAALGVGVWQLRVAVMDRRDGRRRPSTPGAPRAESSEGGWLPVSAPLGRLPAEILGRDELLAELKGALGRTGKRRPPGAWVLAGMGGVGKSTVALWLAAEARRRDWRVWWVNAADPLSLRGGILEILRQLDAPEAIARQVRDGAATAADRFWTFLDETEPKRGLLIFDNADTPAALAPDGVSTPADGTGWVRPSSRILTVVTTRSGDSGLWGAGVRVRPLKVLDEDAAAAVLRGLAPRVPDPGGQETLALARRLGALPLALHLAGTYLSSPFARWRDFGEYRLALDSEVAAEAIADLDSGRVDARATVSRTWELSLDALVDQGMDQARQCLYVLSCFAPATPIPMAMLGSEPNRRSLRGLTDVALIEVSDSGVIVHPLVADTCRARVLTTHCSDGGTVMKAAVRLARNACAELDHERPGDWPAWEQLIPHITAMVTSLAPHLDPEDLSSLLDLSHQAFSSLWGIGRQATPDGEALARASLTAAQRLGDDHPDTLTARYILGISLYNRGAPREAEEAFHIVLAGRRKILGEDHVDTLLTRDQLNGAVLAQGRFSEAEQIYRELLADMTRALGAEHRETLTTRVDLAWAIGMQGRPDEAAEICRQTLDIDRRVMGAEDPRTLDAWADLARWTNERGEHRQAEQMCRELLDIERRVLGASHQLTLSTQATHARTIAMQGRLAEAVHLLTGTLEEMERQLGDGNHHTIMTRGYLADALSRTGH